MRDCPQNFQERVERNEKRVNRLRRCFYSFLTPRYSFLLSYFRLSEDRSTVTPGPMVELSEIFCR